jgi:hypothetical protein
MKDQSRVELTAGRRAEMKVLKKVDLWAHSKVGSRGEKKADHLVCLRAERWAEMRAESTAERSADQSIDKSARLSAEQWAVC